MKYRKKPVVIEALKLERTSNSILEILTFMTFKSAFDTADRDVVEAIRTNGGIVIPTLEGDMFAAFGDFIIKGVQGEFYPCKPDIFHATYEVVE